MNKEGTQIERGCPAIYCGVARMGLGLYGQKKKIRINEKGRLGNNICSKYNCVAGGSRRSEVVFYDIR